MSVPVALTIAGSDSGGGAGIQADLKTFAALGVYGASAITALTAQNTREVRAIYPVPADFVACQIETVLDDIRVDAVKTGMLGEAELIATVARTLAARGLARLVVDPVMVAKSGDRLLPEAAVAALKEHLVPLALVITPNLPEAEVLLGRPIEAAEMADAAAELARLGPRAVLLKGGHTGGAEAVDVLYHRGRVLPIAAPRVATRNTHGTGCTLAAAIAAGLAHGRDLEAAVRAAKDYVSRALAGADRLGVGSGHGPLDHFHALWPCLAEA